MPWSMQTSGADTTSIGATVNGITEVDPSGWVALTGCIHPGGSAGGDKTMLPTLTELHAIAGSLIIRLRMHDADDDSIVLHREEVEACVQAIAELTRLDRKVAK